MLFIYCFRLSLRLRGSSYPVIFNHNYLHRERFGAALPGVFYPVGYIIDIMVTADCPSMDNFLNFMDNIASFWYRHS